jgi:hypothetical protein
MSHHSFLIPKQAVLRFRRRDGVFEPFDVEPRFGEVEQVWREELDKIFFRYRN